METQYNQSFGNQSLSAINQHQLEMTQSLTVNQNPSPQYSSLVHMPKHTKSEFINYLIIQDNPSQTQAFQKDQATLNQSSVSNFASNNILGPSSQIIQQQNMSSSNQGQNQEKNIQPEQTLMLIGEKGYRTALCSHGFNDGCYYLEVEMLQPQMPLPFINVQPSLRVGFAVYDDQDLELPLGAHSRSYCYSSTGQLVTNSKNIYKQPNDSFCQGDVIGAFIYLKPPKPKFLQQNPKQEQI